MLSSKERMSRKRTSRKYFAESVPIESRHELIPYHFSVTEFEVQAYLYAEIIQIGYQVRGNVASRCLTCVFDLVVYRDGIPIRVIEVKKCDKKGCTRKTRRAEERKRQAQVERYSWFGIQVDLVTSMRHAKEYIANLKLTPY